MKNSEKNVNLLNLIAFVALVVVAVLQIFVLLNATGLLNVSGFLPNLLDTIKNVCICIVIGVVSYNFVARKKKGYKITYWVCLLIIILTTILVWIF